MRIDDPIFSGSVVGSDAVVSLSGSFTGSGTIENAATASKLKASASFGLGMESFNFDGSTNQVISVDTASVHFISGALEAVAASTGSFVVTGSISGLTQSFTKGDGSTFEINLPDTGSVDLLFEITGGLGVDPFAFDNTANAQVQLDTSSAHFTVGVSASQAPIITALSASLTTTDQTISSSVAALSASASTSRIAVSASLTTTDQVISSSLALLSASAVITASITATTMSFTKGDLSTFDVLLPADLTVDTSSLLITSSITGLTQSFTKGDGSTYDNLLPETGSFITTASYSTGSIGGTVNTMSFTKGDGTIFGVHISNSVVSVTPSAVNNLLAARFEDGTTVSAPVISSSYAVTASHAISISGTLSNGALVDAFSFNGSDNATVNISTYSASASTSRTALSASLTTTDQTISSSVAALSASASTSRIALSASLTTTDQTISSSVATLSGSASTARNTAALQVSGAFSAQSASLTATDQIISSSVAALSASASTSRIALSASLTATDQVISSSVAALSASTSTAREFYIITGSISGLTQSFTKGNGSTFEINLPDTGSPTLSTRITGALGVDPFIFNGTADAQVQVNTSSAHFIQGASAVTASLSASLTTTDQTISSSVAALSASASTSRTALSASLTTTDQTISSSVAALSASAASALTAQSASNAVNFVSQSIYNIQTGSFVTTASISGLTQSFTKGDGSTFEINLPDTGSPTLSTRITGALGIEAFTFNGTADAQVQVDTASAHFIQGASAVTASLSASLTTTDQTISSSVAALSASASTSRLAVSASLTATDQSISASLAILSSSAILNVETSSVRQVDTLTITKGDGTTFDVTHDTSSFVKTVNLAQPNPVNGNVSISIQSVETGTSGSMLAASSSALLNEGDIWVISGETGGGPFGSGSNGKAYIFNSGSTPGSGELLPLYSIDEAENDVRYVQVAGDTMTGALILSQDPTNVAGAATKRYVDPAFTTASIATGSDGSHTLTFTRLGGGTQALTFTSSSFAVTSSHAITASYVESSSFAVTSSHAITASYVESSSFAVTSSHAITASYVESSSFAVTSSHAITASYVESSSFAVTSSHAITASYVESSSFAVTSSHAITASYVESSSFAVTSSHAITASYVESSSFAVTSSHAITASYVESSSFAVTSSYSITSSLSQTASFANKVSQSLTQGLGINTLTYDGSTAEIVQLDTSSAHFITGVSESLGGQAVIVTGSFTGSFEGVLAGTASRVESALTGGLGVDTFTYDGSVGRGVQINTSSLHFRTGATASIVGNVINPSSVIVTKDISVVADSRISSSAESRNYVEVHDTAHGAGAMELAAIDDIYLVSNADSGSVGDIVFASNISGTLASETMRIINNNAVTNKGLVFVQNDVSASNFIGTSSISLGKASQGVAITMSTYDGSGNTVISLDTSSLAFAAGVAEGMSSASYAGLSIDFSGSNLDFSLANLSGSDWNFSGSTIDFSDVNFSGSTIVWSGSNIDFSDVNFSGSTFDFSGSTLDLSGAVIVANTASYSGSFNYAGSTINGGSYVGASFSGSSAFTGSFDFSNADVTGLSITPNYAPTTQSADFTAVAARAYIVTQSTAAITMSLPASPSNGDSIKLANMDDRANLIERNGERIMGVAEDMTLNVEQVSFELIYESSTNMGWVIYGARAIT